MSDLNYYNSPDDFDVCPHVAQASTLGVVNSAFPDQNQQEYIPHLREVFDIDVIIREASSGVGFTQPLQGVVKLHIDIPCNYIFIQPSAQNNQVIIALGDIRFYRTNGNIFWPIGDASCIPNGQPYRYDLPTRRNYMLSLFVVPPLASAFPYTDAVRIIYGYLPNADEKVVLR